MSTLPQNQLDREVDLPPAQTITLVINGQEHEMEVPVWATLLDTLRERLQLTGTKKGCDHGQCGACTVLVDGKHINSCLSLAVMQEGKEITTIEGLAKGDRLHPVQEAFIEEDAFQCGYCTPGQICATVGLINTAKAKDLNDVRDLISGNICRCGAYSNIAKVAAQFLLDNH